MTDQHPRDQTINPQDTPALREAVDAVQSVGNGEPLGRLEQDAVEWAKQLIEDRYRWTPSVGRC